MAEKTDTNAARRGARTERRLHRRSARLLGAVALPVAALALPAVAVAGPADVGPPTGASRLAPAVPAAGAAATLTGTVEAAGTAVAGAQVTLRVGRATDAPVLGTATTDAGGAFSIDYATPVSGVLYAVAAGGAPTADPDPATSPVHLVTVVGIVGPTAAVPAVVHPTVTIDELTTVAAGYSLARFADGDVVSGPAVGLDIAAATTFNLVDPATGAAGGVVTNADNGATNDTLATLGTLANALGACAGGVTLAPCDELRSRTTPPGGATPATTFAAMVDLARNPSLSRPELFALAATSPLVTPALAAPPEAWLLALHYRADQMYAPGRMAFDATGRLWTNNNWTPGTTDPSPYIVALSPTGTPILGSPIAGGGTTGSGWGAAIDIDGSFWISNFAGDSVSHFSPSAQPLSPTTGFTQGAPLSPQGLAVDQRGNVWVANNSASEAPGVGSVTYYPLGDPTRAVNLTGGGIDHPFAVQIDAHGNAWVTNAGVVGGSVTVITPDLRFASFSPIEDPALASPKGLAFDRAGNAWVASFENNHVVLIHPDGTIGGSFALPGVLGPWGIAVDAADHVWVAGFKSTGVWELCGVDLLTCPPGSTTGTVLSTGLLGYSSKTLQHVTAVQLDQAGNVWAANNWSDLTPPTGGDGLMEFVGLGTPVCTPLIGLPARPTTSAGGACPSYARVQPTAPTTPASPASPVAAAPAFTG